MKVKGNFKNSGNQILPCQKNLIFQSCDGLMLVLWLLLTLIRWGRCILCVTENGSETDVV